MYYKIVQREPLNNRVIQIYEVYRSNVGAKVQELIDNSTTISSITVTPLREA